MFRFRAFFNSFIYDTAFICEKGNRHEDEMENKIKLKFNYL